MEINSVSSSVTINASSETVYISKIEITPLTNAALQDPELTFTDITGDITKELSEGSYNSVATTASDAPIVYSSSNTDIATIDNGTVTLHAKGTTVIKAEVAETETFNAASIQYTLTVIDPASMTTFVKVTNGTVTDGKYIIVYQERDDATSVVAMNTTNTKNYFMYDNLNLLDGTIITDNQSIIWDITTESDGNYSISNNGVYVAYNGNKTSDENKAYPDAEYTTERAGWRIEYDNEQRLFLFKNIGVDTRLLQFNAASGQERFACYTGKQKNLTLYKLDSGKQAVTVTFNEISGNKEVFFTESFTYNSAATATPERPIIYSSSNQEVATINAEGIVTVVGSGTTIIKASTDSNDSYEEGVAQYTLTVRASSVTLPYSTDFKSGLGDWISATTVGSTQWESTSDGAQINGYKAGETEAYLISPEMTEQNIVLTFSSSKDYTGNDLQLLYSTNYDPNTMQPTEAEWIDITDKASWPNQSDDVILTELNSPIRVAFKYTCSSSQAASWTITDLSIQKAVTKVVVTFDEVSGDKSLFFEEGLTYNSAATTDPERPITYSSSNQEVATIDATGLVTLVGPGTTVIKATTEADDTYREGVAQYTLTVQASSVTLPYSTDFKSGLGDWISATTVGSAQWTSDSQYGAKISGYINGKDTDSEAYLISPAVTASNIILNFNSWFNYDGNALELLYSTDYDPNTMQPTDATWNNISENATWPTEKYNWVESGDIELQDLTSPIRFAFRYTSTTDGASTWEITDLSIKEGLASGIATIEANGMKIINGKGEITIVTDTPASVAIYTLTGAQVRQIELTEGNNVVTLPAGIYVINRQKVVVF